MSLLIWELGNVLSLAAQNRETQPWNRQSFCSKKHKSGSNRRKIELSADNRFRSLIRIATSSMFKAASTATLEPYDLSRLILDSESPIQCRLEVGT